jgi:hypothetical protein
MHEDFVQSREHLDLPVDGAWGCFQLVIPVWFATNCCNGPRGCGQIRTGDLFLPSGLQSLANSTRS